MEYRRETVAKVKYGSNKNAALFFDYVIPLSGRGLGHELDGRLSDREEQFDFILDNILPKDLNKGGAHSDQYDNLLREANILRLNAKHYFKLGMHLDEAIEKEGEDFRAGFNNACSLLESKSESFKFSTQIEYDFSESKYSDGDDIFVSLMNLDAIDVNQTTWEQIIEFRKDETSVKNFRRLKLFLYNDYQGKPASFIEDDILNRIEDYNDSIKKWKFETTNSTFESILCSKGLYASSTLSMISAFYGSPSLAALSGGSAAAIALGQIGLKIFKAKNDKIHLREDSPIAYLLTAQQKLGG